MEQNSVVPMNKMGSLPSSDEAATMPLCNSLYLNKTVPNNTIGNLSYSPTPSGFAQAFSTPSTAFKVDTIIASTSSSLPSLPVIQENQMLCSRGNQNDEVEQIEDILMPQSVQENEWVPDCNEDLKPKLGQLFDRLEDGEKFYKKYAHSVGFSVRAASSSKHKDGMKRWKYFVCSKEGYKPIKSEDLEQSKSVAKPRTRCITREGCNAKVGFKLVGEGKYEIARFHESHCHKLVSPSKRMFLRSARKVNPVHKSLLKAFNKANIGASKTYQLLKEQLGGYENVGCTQRDLQNYSRDLKAMMKDSDAHVFIDNFKRKQEANASFYHAYELDSEGRLKHVFWADVISRKNYSLFGDVISFDTTYETNKYSMIFAPFTGVNHHRQCVTFGAAFLADEKVDSFMWLFEKFLEAMGGRQPNLIITDQDPAMKIAIERIFSSSSHRFCMWHIMRKVSEKLGVSLNASDEFQNDFKSCVWNSETPEEFEEAWKSIMVKFELQKNDWLCGSLPSLKTRSWLEY